MCELLSRLGPDICHRCPPVKRLFCPHAHIPENAAQVLGNQQVRKFNERAQGLPGYETATPEPPAGEFRLTEWQALENASPNHRLRT